MKLRLFAIMAMIFALSFVLGAEYKEDSLKYELERLKEYRSTYLYKQGCTSLWKGTEFLCYKLRTFDGGKSWYAVNTDNEILGLSDKIYPGLLKSLNAWDKLTDYAIKNGPITLGNKKEIDLLKNAGFEIKE